MSHPSEEFDRLRAAIEHRSDLELRFECGQSVRVHSIKLSLASSVLRDLFDDVIDEQIETAKRRRDDERPSAGSTKKQALVDIKVSQGYLG